MRDEPNAIYTDSSFVDDDYGGMYRKGLTGYIFKHIHKVLEESLPLYCQGGRVILEVGAGDGHIGYLKHSFQEYFLTDASQEVLEHARAVNSDSRVKFTMTLAEKLPFADHAFDRLIACNVLEHIYHPHEALREWNRVVRPGGIISLILPCDPGLAWRMGRLVSSTRRLMLRKGLPYEYVMAREHVNPIGNLVSIIRYHFENIHELWWPLRIHSTDANLFYCAHIIV